MGRPRALFLLVAALALATGCASGVPAAKDGSGVVAPKPAAVSDADFARRLYEVIADGTPSTERHAKLLGVVRAQLLHARERFERGADDRATRSVLGAMYLLRAGEGSDAVVDAETARAVDGAIRRLSARGDAGRARVLLSMRVATSAGVERRELQQHIAALDRFSTETLTGRPIERLGDAQRTAASRAVLDPGGIDDAVRVTSDWIDLSIEHNVAFRQTGKRPTTEEAIEMTRGLGTGAAVVVALMLRYGDLAGALESIDASSAKRVIDPDLYAQLQQALSRDDAPSWRGVYSALHAHTEGRVGGELGIDAELLEAALFVTLIEAHRRDKAHLATSVELGRALGRLGMSEAVPLVLGPAFVDGGTPADVAVALRTLVSAVDADATANDFSAARRTIQASSGLLSRAKALGPPPGAAGARLLPTVADVRYRMASVLVRGGNLDVAHGLIQGALADQPTPEAHLLLASVERQRGRLDEALAAADKVAASSGPSLEAADAHLMAFEIHRDKGRVIQAQAALAKALESTGAVLDKKPAGRVRVRALRTLGRVLAGYGDPAGSRRAFAKAMEEAKADRALLGATMLSAASAALVQRDLVAARAALKKGVEDGAPHEDLVYGALWLVLAERQQGGAPDATAAEILDAAAGAPTWVGKLAAWAKGRLTDEALLAHASSEATRVEAIFYVAMAKRAGGAAADDSLRRVAQSPVLDLMEVQIARDILAPPTSFSLPKGAKIP
jgi:tetratricopeptide (TPR) repeat protein